MNPFLEEQFSLAGEVAVVTGGGGELCGAMAHGFARAGARVAIVDYDAAKGQGRLETLRKAGAEAIFVQADLTKKAEVERVAEDTRKAFGKITIALNGVGNRASH